MYEIDGDLFEIVPSPTICERIRSVYRDSEAARDFLKKDVISHELNEAMAKITKDLDQFVLNNNTLEAFVDQLKNSIDRVAQIIFKNPAVIKLPSSDKEKLNYLIFNVLTARYHFRLIKAYSDAYRDKNILAQKALRERPQLNVDQEKMEIAIAPLRSIVSMPTASDAILCVVKFFDDVVKAIPGPEIAADDILPAMCMAMAADLSLKSQAVSFFQYCMDIWPTTGMSERITYCLVTCSIAASHLGMGPMPVAPSPAPVAAPVIDMEVKKKTEETIDMLEDLLQSFE
jgi:arsenate reductase-like glutaredoxin family protein